MTSSSSMMVIRVLPGDEMTAPRLALLKSYSSRMVSICLAATGLASGSQTHPLFALSVNEHQHPTQCVHSQSACSACAKPTPCFRRFVLALVGSNSAGIQNYAYAMHICKRVSMRGALAAETFDIRGSSRAQAGSLSARSQKVRHRSLRRKPKVSRGLAIQSAQSHAGGEVLRLPSLTVTLSRRIGSKTGQMLRIAASS